MDIAIKAVDQSINFSLGKIRGSRLVERLKIHSMHKFVFFVHSFNITRVFFN